MHALLWLDFIRDLDTDPFTLWGLSCFFLGLVTLDFIVRNRDLGREGPLNTHLRGNAKIIWWFKIIHLFFVWVASKKFLLHQNMHCIFVVCRKPWLSFIGLLPFLVWVGSSQSATFFVLDIKRLFAYGHIWGCHERLAIQLWCGGTPDTLLFFSGKQRHIPDGTFLFVFFLNCILAA